MTKCARIRRILLRHPLLYRLWRVVLFLFGQIVLFWRRPKMTEAQIAACYSMLRPGDVLGVYSRRYLTGLFLPKGAWGVEHTAIYLDWGLVLDPIMPRVRVLSLRRFLSQYDRVVIARTVADRTDMHEKQAAAITCAVQLEDRHYDCAFADGAEMVYCHEVGALVQQAAGLHPVKKRDFWLFDDLAIASIKTYEVQP